MKIITDLDIKNKTVIVRCDFNVPVENNIIVDNSRIEKAIPTIEYLLNNNCKVILLSHMGRIKTDEDKNKYSLRIVGEELSKLLNKKITFISECYGKNVTDYIKQAPLGEIILLENTRYMDLYQKAESQNDLELAQYWAGLADIFVLDAFGCAHRAHASTAGIAKYIPSCIGFLIENEIKHLKEIKDNAEHPFTVFMGGAKVEDKLPIIKELINKCDYLLLGGGLANSFLKATGFNIGSSLATTDGELLVELKSLYDRYEKKVILPSDFIYDSDAIMDLGDKTINEYADLINKSKITFINGTPGKFEDEKFSKGTKDLFNKIKESPGKIIIGGGDTLNAIKEFGNIKDYYFASSGGGATLEYIAKGELEAITWIENNSN